MKPRNRAVRTITYESRDATMNRWFVQSCESQWHGAVACLVHRFTWQLISCSLVRSRNSRIYKTRLCASACKLVYHCFADFIVKPFNYFFTMSFYCQLFSENHSKRLFWTTLHVCALYLLIFAIKLFHIFIISLYKNFSWIVWKKE